MFGLTWYSNPPRDIEVADAIKGKEMIINIKHDPLLFSKTKKTNDNAHTSRGLNSTNCFTDTV